MLDPHSTSRRGSKIIRTQITSRRISTARLGLAASVLGALVLSGCVAESSDDAENLGQRGDALRAALPGRIQAEDYNAGGEGVGYHDTTAGNAGGVYRTDSVDIEVSTDTGGGYDVGWTAAGEWLAYDVSIPRADNYSFTVRLASAQTDPKTVHFELDGAALAGATATLTGGNGWETFQDVVIPSVALPAGNHTLKLVLDSTKVNINYFDVAELRAPLVIGMYNDTAVAPGAETATGSNFRNVANTFFVGGKVKVHRVFNQAWPKDSLYSNSGGADDPANGNVSFLSVKPENGDVAGTTAGNYDAHIATLAASIPAGSYFTMFHEPEDDMSGATFVPMFKHFYQVAKAANPSLQIGYVAMAYQWRPGSASTATPDAWWMGAGSTDFLAVDAYDQRWMPAESLDTEPDFQRWYGWAKTKNKPLLIAEYGVENSGTAGFTDAQRATIIQNSMNWVWSQPLINMVLYWNGTKATPGGRDHFLNPTTSLPTDNFALARAAWNNATTAYGSSNTSITTW